MKLGVVIVHYCTERLTLNCLFSLSDELRAIPGSHAFIVDNNSGDGSIQQIEFEIRSRGDGDLFTFLYAPTNGGFSAGNNIGICAALSGNAASNVTPYDALLLLNSDTLVHAGALKHMASAMEHCGQIGILGPQLEWRDGQQQASCFRNITPISEMLVAAKMGPLTRVFRSREVLLPTPVQNSEIDWISFACVLVRREVFETIGLLDEGFFMYFEDVDFCRRARAHGWSIAFEPEARIIHLRGNTTAETFEVAERRRRPRFYYAARSRYFAKYYGRMGPLAANLLWWCGRIVSIGRECLGGKKPHLAERESLDIWIEAFKSHDCTVKGKQFVPRDPRTDRLATTSSS